jgi:4-hydroxy-3-polyprenylbenzoate decarboxylase
VVGVTGASGTPYAARLLRALLDAGEPVDLVLSKASRLTILDETGHPVRDGRWQEDVRDWIGRDVGGIRYWAPGDFAAGPSSGSYPTRGMVVAPATTAAVSGIAVGASKDLIQRAADVTLKERRPLVLLVRETPLRAVALEQMASLAREGATIMPATPAFYAGATSVGDLVDFVVGRVLDQLGVGHVLFRRWTGQVES